MPSELQKLLPDELHEAWPALSDDERLNGFRLLTEEEARDFLSHRTARDVLDLMLQLPRDERRAWLRELPPDDIVDVVQELPEEEQPELLALLDEKARQEAVALLEYSEDDAGGLMTPRCARLRPDMTVSQALSYLRTLARQNAELIYYGYVVDSAERLVGVVSFRELVIAPVQQKIRDLMTTDLATIPDDMDQEEVARIFAHEDLYCLPVVDADGHMKGIVTADDVVDVVEEEATEDMHKMGGSEALEAPYLQAGFLEMMHKRGIWLIILLLLGFLTVEVMSRFDEKIAEYKVLAYFVPLIIACGGNTGSQASTLIVRAMALDQVRLRDWRRVLQREVLNGLSLGLMLALTGLVAALLWNGVWIAAGDPRLGGDPHHAAIAVASSILLVVLWGAVAGSMLPFVLRRIGADPASASAPLVATLVDASGLVIYFVIGVALLRVLGG
jgi:magnesium transporter